MRARLEGILAFGAVCALAGSAALLASSAAQAAPAPEFTLAFEDLAPGTPESRTETFVLDRDATLTGFAWVEREGVLRDAALAVTVCDAAGACADAAAVTRTPFAGGPVEVTVTAELTADTGPGATGSATGQLTFTADDAATSAGGGLAATGSDAAVWLAVLCAMLASGAFLVALRRRSGSSSAPRRVEPEVGGDAARPGTGE